MPGPRTLILHTVSTTTWVDACDLRTGIEARLPDIDLVVAEDPEQSRAALDVAEVVVASFLPDWVVDAAPSLRWVQALSAGVDFYDLDRLGEAGIAVTTAAGVHAEPVGEQVLGYILTFERGLHRAIRQQHRGVWERFEGGEVRGKTVGVVGVGAIGTRVAELAGALGASVVGVKGNPDTAPAAVDEVYGPDDLPAVLRRSDYLVIACPLTDETHGMIGALELGMLPDEAVLVNVGRGEIVDQDALAVALQQGEIRGAALDVFEEEPLAPDSVLWDLSNVVVTPHMGGSSPHKDRRLAERFAENYRAYVDGGREALDHRVV